MSIYTNLLLMVTKYCLLKDEYIAKMIVSDLGWSMVQEFTQKLI